MKFNLPLTALLLSCSLTSLFTQPALGENKESATGGSRQTEANFGLFGLARGFFIFS